MENDYLKYRGKCKELCEDLVAKDPSLRLVKGWYYEAWWNKEEQHFWCEDKEGNIVDPSGRQFPSGGGNEFKSFYREFIGVVNCEECGKEIDIDDAVMQGRYPCCSMMCAGKLVGLL
jgi:hypothetical protein